MELASVSSYRTMPTSTNTSLSLSSNNGVTSTTNKSSILHVRENSLDELEALFDPSKWASRTQNNPKPPLHKRNLPASFFRPPLSTAGGTKSSPRHYLSIHGRQASMDHTTLLINHNQNTKNHQLSSSPCLLKKQHIMKIEPTTTNTPTNTAPTTNLNVNSPQHLRSASEPVSMVEVGGNGNGEESSVQLPYGWQQAKTADGRFYYLNFLTKQTSWQPPLTNNDRSHAIDLMSTTTATVDHNPKHHNQQEQQQQLHLPTHHHHNHHNAVSSPSSSQENLHGGGGSSNSSSSRSSFDADSNIYHAAAAAAAAARLNPHHQNHMNNATTKIEMILSQIPMPLGWQEARTSRGEPYFINHNLRTTCWDDPRLPFVPAYLAQLETSAASNLVANLNPHHHPLHPSQQQQQHHLLSQHNQQHQPSPPPVQQINQIEHIKTTLIESINRKMELVKSLEELNKKESFLRSQLNMVMSGHTPSSSSSASSSCDVTDDLNTADVDLTCLEAELDQPNEEDVKSGILGGNSGSSSANGGETTSEKQSNSNSVQGNDSSSDDDDLSSLDLNNLDGQNGEDNDELSSTIIVANTGTTTTTSDANNLFEDLGTVKIERSTDLEHVSNMYTKMLINNSLNGVSGNGGGMVPQEVVVNKARVLMLSESGVISTNGNISLKRSIADTMDESDSVNNNGVSASSAYKHELNYEKILTSPALSTGSSSCMSSSSPASSNNSMTIPLQTFHPQQQQQQSQPPQQHLKIQLQKNSELVQNVQLPLQNSSMRWS